MMALRILETPVFSRCVKKLHVRYKNKLDIAISEIAVDPTIGDEKKGELAGVYVYRFEINKHETLLAYSLQPGKLKPKELVLLNLIPYQHITTARSAKESR